MKYLNQQQWRNPCCEQKWFWVIYWPNQQSVIAEEGRYVGSVKICPGWHDTARPHAPASRAMVHSLLSLFTFSTGRHSEVGFFNLDIITVPTVQWWRRFNEILKRSIHIDITGFSVKIVLDKCLNCRWFLQETVQVACNNCILCTGWFNGIGVKIEELYSVGILVLQWHSIYTHLTM